MDLNIGQIYNSAVNIGLAASDASKGPSEGSLKDFLQTLTTYGVQINSNYMVEYSGMNGLQFMVQQINTPELKTTNGTLYYKGRVVNVPVNYEQGHDFTMTVINDGTGYVYNSIRAILINDYCNRQIKNNYKMTIHAMGDKQNTAGMKIMMNGIRFINVGSLSFSSTDSSVQTFEVQC